jgi:predicted lipoprotein with Yx(FWY)xxD motif
VTRGARPAFSGPRLAVPAAIAVAIIGFVILSAVAGSPSSERGKPAAAVALRATKLGRILVDSGGRTLYLFLEDSGPRSTCYGGCARVWPPALVSGRPTAGPGVLARKLSSAKRRFTSLRQLVYNGHPLYTADADQAPGDLTGQGFFGTWFVVSPLGKQVGKAAKGAGGY